MDDAQKKLEAAKPVMEAAEAELEEEKVKV